MKLDSKKAITNKLNIVLPELSIYIIFLLSFLYLF